MQESRAPLAAHSTLEEMSGYRAVRIARTASKLAMVAAVALALWLLVNWVSGGDHVAVVSIGTVDGNGVGRYLAFATWLALAVALVFGIFAARRDRLSLDKDIDVSKLTESQALAPLEGTRAARSQGPGGRTRWIGVGIVAAGALLVIGTYHGLLRPGAITWGDWGYFVKTGEVRNFFPVPSLWSFGSLGSNNILGASLAPVDSAMGVFARLGLSYPILERLCFYFLAVALSYAGPLLLARRLQASWTVAVGAGVFYCVNPYALVLVSGGQLTVGVGYALFPWVALAALRLWSKRTIGSGLVLGGVIGVQAWYDPRTAGLSVAGVIIALMVLTARGRRPTAHHQIPWAGGASAGLVFLLLQGAWMVPSLLAIRAHLPAGYTTTSSLATFSLLSLADGLTAFHPFWPNMHFIALHSVPALWLIVPIAVAVSLLRDPLDQRAQVGGALYLIFAALVSGANAPFGVVNSWLFIHVPGMDLFRDPSPYLGPVVLGLVIVASAPGTWFHQPAQRRQLPEATMVAHQSSGSKASVQWWTHIWKQVDHGDFLRFSAAILVFVMIVVSAWPALSGTLRHDLAPRPVPARYLRLDQAILQGAPGAVLWIPSTSRFAPVSPEHPSVSAFALESTSGVGFPDIVQGLDWLSVPSVVEAILHRYDIRTVVVREDASAYRTISVPAGAARAQALSSLRAVPGIAESTLPHLAVFHLSETPAYPVAVFQQSGTPTAGSSQTKDTLSKMSAVPLRQELSQTSFVDGLRDWGRVGDGNNYLHQTTLSQAGISASVQGDHHKQRWLHLAVRYGAASMSQALKACPKPSLQELRIRYRTSTSASLGASVFSAAQSKPLGNLTLPSTDGRWVTASVPFVLSKDLTLAMVHSVRLTDCEFALSAQPTVAGIPSSADIASLSLTAVVPSVSNAVANTTQGGGRWDRPTSPQAVSMAARTGDTTTLTIPASRQPRLVVFWQRYNQGWVARAAGIRTLHHVEVNGWANGYIVPRSDREVSVTIAYAPQSLTVDGFFLVLAGFALLLAGGMFTMIRWWTRNRRVCVR